MTQMLFDRKDLAEVKANLEKMRLNFSPVTTTKFPKRKKDWLLFWARNVEKLVKLIRDLPPSVEFDMGTWGEVAVDGRKHSCGTVGCALGTAAMSGKFPGLQYRLDLHAFTDRGLSPFASIDAVVNGRNTLWFEAGSKFFGDEVWYSVFTNDYEADKASVVAKLRSYARNYRARAEKLP